MRTGVASSRAGFRLILLFGLFTSAQAAGTRPSGNYLLDYWETDDGLPEDSATAMVQTADGYLWFGTFNGLVRFDGVGFTVFDPSNTPELPSPAVVNLFIDRKAALWCSTEKGIARLANGRWQRFGRDEGWTSNYARSFSEDRAKDIMYVTGFDGKVLKFEGEGFHEMAPPPGDTQNGYFGHVDREGFFWVAQSRFTGYWDGSAWIRVAPDVGPEAGEYGAGSARDGGVWILWNKVVQKLTRTGIVAEYTLQQPIGSFWSLIEGSNHDLWICSYREGIFQIKTNGAVVHYTTDQGLPHNSVRFVFADREANFWVGTSGGGLMRVKPRTFRSYGTESGLLERMVKSVAVRANGEVVLGTYGKGVALLDPRPAIPMGVPLDKGGPGYVQSLLEDHTGQLWAGSYGKGLNMIGPDGAVRVRDQADGGDNVAALFEDSRNRMWIAFSERVSRREEGKFTAVGQVPDGVALHDVRVFAEEPVTGVILAANEHSLYRLEGSGFVPVIDRGGHALEQVYSIKCLRDGSIWLGTARGLLRYRQGLVSSITQTNGLPVPAVSTIVEDHSGNWWLGSNRGVVRVDPRQLEAVANGASTALESHWFNVSDGLASVECPSGYQPTAAVGRDGRLWFATLKGVAVVDPSRLRINAQPPPVVIESLTYLDSNRRSQTLQLIGKTAIDLPAGSSQLDVRFAALSFTAPEKMKFAYALTRNEKLMAEEEIAQRKISLNLLPNGKYSLRVTAANNDGIWNHEGAVFSFTVLPFYWQTTWFRFGASAGLAAVLGALFWRSSERRVQIQQEKFEHQKALAEEKARLASVLEGTSDLVGFATPQGKVIFLNRAGRVLLGLSPDEDVTCLEILEFYTSEAKAILREKALPSVTQDGTWSGEVMMRGRSGAQILTSQVLQAHRDSTGAVLFLSAIVRDISESRKLEQQLRHAHKMEALGTLASGIAHDFNNVLSAIIGNIELARVDAGPNQPVVESLNEARKAGIRARDLVQQILAFGRQQVQDRKVLALVPLVTEASRLLRATLPAGIELVLKLSADTPNVLGDASQIHQVVLNLCTNAWQAMDNAVGRIDVRLESVELDSNRSGWRADLPPGKYAQLTVSDNGRGIEPAVLEHIFEPFFTTKTRSRGTGLGLAVVHGIVKNHDGAIHVTSEVGRGTMFQVLFPGTTAPVLTAPVEPEAAIPPRGRGEHILYLDDEAPLVFLASRALERIGYRVTGFTEPNEALAAFRKDPKQFDVVVTDYNMPGTSGLDMAHVFLSLRPDLPVLLTSGYLSDELKVNARAAGVAALIYKPNTVVELREAIHRWVGASNPPPSP